MSRDTRHVGCHVSIAGGLAKALARAAERDADALQIFPSNPRGWSVPDPDPADEAALIDGAQERGWPLFLHAPYLVNLASPDPDIADRSRANVAFALARNRRLGGHGVVVHTGSARGRGRDEARSRVAAVLRRLLDDAADGPTPLEPHDGATGSSSRASILMELTAGQGDMIAGTVEELTELLAVCGDDPRIGVCLDTCHLFSAGHDLTTPRGRARLRDALATLGPERVHLVHVNDSRDPFDSRRDRHARVGTGTIGADALRLVLRRPELAHAAFVLETPGTAADQRDDIALVRSWVAASASARAPDQAC